MVNESQLVGVIKQAKENDKDRKFTQSVEMIMVFKDVDVKKGFALNEIIQLPKQMSQPAAVCVMATGDMGIKAKNAKADMVMNENELTKLSADKKKAKKESKKIKTDEIKFLILTTVASGISSTSCKRLFCIQVPNSPQFFAAPETPFSVNRFNEK